MNIRIYCMILLLFTGLSYGKSPEAKAKIVFSDGHEETGILSIIGSRPLVVHPLGTKRQRKIKIEDIVSIQQHVEKASMEKPWAFKESGKAEKVYFDGEYAVINFWTEVLLISGERIKSHVISAAYRFKSDAGKSKIFLKRQIKGKLNVPMLEIIYPELIVFPEHITTDVPNISGNFVGEKLEKVCAMDLEREFVVHAKVEGQSFEFEDLLPGQYDLCIQTDQSVLLGMSAVVPKDKEGGKPLDLPKDLETIQKNTMMADDFFPIRHVFRIVGTKKYAKSVVFKKRVKYFASERHTPGGFLWHLELWSWHTPGIEWKVDKRFIMVRHKQQKMKQIVNFIS